MIGIEELEWRFAYHPPRDESVGDRHAQVRETLMGAALILDTLCQDSREKSIAMTKLEEAMMWANASIAREHVPHVPKEPR